MRAIAAAIGLGLGLGAAPANAQAPYFTGIGDLPTASFSSEAYGVSDAGVVVGSGTELQGGQFRARAVTWTLAGGLAPLDVAYSHATAISGNGATLLLVAASGGDPVWWTAATGPVALGDVVARALSADGSTVVGRHDTGNPLIAEAFRWTLAGGIEGLGTLPHTNPQSDAWAVAIDGSAVAGNSNNATGAPGFLWTAATGIQPLPPTAPGKGQPRFIDAMSLSGTVVGGRIGAELFTWSATAGYTYFSRPSEFQGAIPRDMNANGFVMVGGNFGDDDGAFYRNRTIGAIPLSQFLTATYGLDLGGWSLDDAVAMSPNGRYIVGRGTNPAGQREGFVAYLGAPPGCGLGFELALVVPILDRLRGRKRRS